MKKIISAIIIVTLLIISPAIIYGGFKIRYIFNANSRQFYSQDNNPQTVLGLQSNYQGIGPIPLTSQIEADKVLKYPVQSKNSCGPYSLSFALKLLGIEIDPELIGKTITWRKTSQSITYPRGLEEYLENIDNPLTKQDLAFFKPKLNHLDDRTKLSFIYRFISQGAPIIVLGEYKGYQHYIVVVGYDQSKQELYVYNPLSKENNEGPGNEIMKENEFLEFRSKGGQYGLYKRYSIVIMPKYDSRYCLHGDAYFCS